MPVYFIQEAQDGPVKIGFTKDNVRARLTELQVGNPRRLKVIRVIAGTREDESRVHWRFRNEALRAEWFSFHPDMLSAPPGTLLKRPAPAKQPRASRPSKEKNRLIVGALRFGIKPKDCAEFFHVTYHCVYMLQSKYAPETKDFRGSKYSRTRTWNRVAVPATEEVVGT